MGSTSSKTEMRQEGIGEMTREMGMEKFTGLAKEILQASLKMMLKSKESSLLMMVLSIKDILRTTS